MNIEGYYLIAEEHSWSEGSRSVRRLSAMTRVHPLAWMTVERATGRDLMLITWKELDADGWKAGAVLRREIAESAAELEVADVIPITPSMHGDRARTWMKPDPDRRDHRPIVYLAHALGGDVEKNAERAQRWLRALMSAYPGVAFCCPWLPFIFIGSDADHPYRERCLLDDVVIAARCDAIVLVGGTVSPGMKLEREATRSTGGTVLDMTDLGREPPSPWTCPIDIAAAIPRRRSA